MYEMHKWYEISVILSFQLAFTNGEYMTIHVSASPASILVVLCVCVCVILNALFILYIFTEFH